MRIVLASLAVAGLPSAYAQACPSLCADGSVPPNSGAQLPVPGVGPVDCQTAASVIAVAPISDAQCTEAQAAAFFICGCPTAPPPNSALPCSFCFDGSVPTNLAATIFPTVGIPGGGEVDTCEGLVALASILTSDASDTALCTQFQFNYASTCGCALPPGPAPTTLAPISSAPITATPTSPAPVTLAVTNPPTVVAIADSPAPSTTEVVDSPAPSETPELEEPAVVDSPAPSEVLVVEESPAPSSVAPVSDTVPADDETDQVITPTASPAPSIVADVSSNMPSGADTGTSMPFTSPPSEGPVSAAGLTPFPTDEPTSGAIATGTLTAMAFGLIAALA